MRPISALWKGGSHPKPWTCDKCKQAIASGDGYVLVMGAESHGYPQRATSTGVELTEEVIEARRAKGKPTGPPFGTYTLARYASPRTRSPSLLATRSAIPTRT